MHSALCIFIDCTRRKLFFWRKLRRFLETDFVIVNLSRSVCLVSVIIQERTPSSHANIQAPLTDFPSDLDIDVQSPDGVMVELQLHKSEMTDDVPVLVMHNGGIVRIPIPSTDVSYTLIKIMQWCRNVAQASQLVNQNELGENQNRLISTCLNVLVF